ncbi:MAG: zinc ribbon domain-containing protein, partial [Candidatus Omnitrophica bacterium]|nr:zinc ribbon domain-containing protein [Candidatus Omnitrophota bacterium]
MRFLKVLAGLFFFLILSSQMTYAAVCGNCGYDNLDKYKYCVKCGQALTAEATIEKRKKINSFSEALSGPKKTIAVTEFTNASGLGSYINLGDDFSAQL